MKREEIHEWLKSFSIVLYLNFLKEHRSIGVNRPEKNNIIMSSFPVYQLKFSGLTPRYEKLEKQADCCFIQMFFWQVGSVYS